MARVEQVKTSNPPLIGLCGETDPLIGAFVAASVAEKP